MAGAIINPVTGYPTTFGNKKAEAFDWTGPNPYVAGGVSLPSSVFGWGAFDGGFGAVSESATYRAEFRFSAKGPQQTVKVVVFVMATGLEAGAIDLSAEIFRLFLLGD